MSRALIVLLSLLVLYLCVVETVQTVVLIKAVEFARQELSARE